MDLYQATEHIARALRKSGRIEDSDALLIALRGGTTSTEILSSVLGVLVRCGMNEQLDHLDLSDEVQTLERQIRIVLKETGFNPL